MSEDKITAFGGRISVDRPDFYCTPTESYGVLGWIETGIMILAGIAGVISLFPVAGTSTMAQTLVKARLGMAVLVGLLTLFWMVMAVFRFFEGELFGLVFSFYLIITHFFCLMGALFGRNPGPWIFVFSFLLILAGLVKLIFLFLRSDFEVRYLPRKALFIITGISTIAYTVLMILQIVNWLASYDGSTSI